MDRDDIITRIHKEIEDMQKTIDDEEGLTDEQKSELTEEIAAFRTQLDQDDPGEEDVLSELATLPGFDMEALDAAGNPAETGTWREIRRIMVEVLELKHILYSDGEDDGTVTAQFGMADEEGRKLVMRVIFTPKAKCVLIRAGYHFDIDRRVLPIARMFICRRNFETRFTRIEIDATDGEVYACVVMRSEDLDTAPTGFAMMMHLAISEGFEEYDTLHRYSRGEFTDEERAAFLEEVERISPLMLEDDQGK